MPPVLSNPVYRLFLERERGFLLWGRGFNAKAQRRRDAKMEEKKEIMGDK